MAEIVKWYRQQVPACRFIGKQYGDGDRGPDGGFGKQWNDWFQNKWFEPLEALTTKEFQSSYEDGDASIGLMRWKEGEPFEYWIGMFLPTGASVPQGYGSIDFDQGTLGVVWLKGKDGEVYGVEHLCAKRLEEEGQTIIADATGTFCFFERYGCSRFCTPDDNGDIILDICHFVK